MAIPLIVQASQRQFAQGLAAVAPMAIAAVPIGLVWGALAAERGLTLLECALMSATVFAGAAQFLALGLWAAPLPVAGIVLATLLVNLRHVMMSASLSRKMASFTLPQRYVAYFGMTDEVWALAESRSTKMALAPAYYAGLVLPMLLAWLTGTLAGAAFGHSLGDPKTLGFDFVFTAVFVALVMGFRRMPSWLPVVASSALMATLAYALLSGPWYVLIGSLTAMAVAAWRAPAATEDAP